MSVSSPAWRTDHVRPIAMTPVRLAALLFAIALPITAHAQVTVSDAWVRGTVGGQRATGAFMKLVAGDDVALVGARSPVAATVEIHEMKMDGGTMRMRAVDRLPLEKGRAVELAPGGYHVMLMGLTKPVNPGDAVPITLTFEDRSGKRSTVEVSATVKPLTSGHGNHGGMKH
jgi:copper(I)-binding protein